MYFNLLYLENQSINIYFRKHKSIVEIGIS